MALPLRYHLSVAAIGAAAALLLLNAPDIGMPETPPLPVLELAPHFCPAADPNTLTISLIEPGAAEIQPCIPLPDDGRRMRPIPPAAPNDLGPGPVLTL